MALLWVIYTGFKTGVACVLFNSIRTAWPLATNQLNLNKHDLLLYLGNKS